jgi:ketosteroid isomerase-like protein
MSQANVELVERAIALLAESFRTGEVEPAMLELGAPDIRIDATRRVFNPDVYDGHEGLRRCIREIHETWEGFTETTEQLIDAGDSVVVLQTISGRGRVSRAAVELRGAAVWRVRRGLLARVDLFLDQDEALAFAGVAR